MKDELKIKWKESGGKGEIPVTVGTETRDGGSRWLACC